MEINYFEFKQINTDVLFLGNLFKCYEFNSVYISLFKKNKKKTVALKHSNLYVSFFLLASITGPHIQ